MMTRAKLEKITHVVALAALSGVGLAGCRHASAEAKISRQEARRSSKRVTFRAF